MNYQQAMQQSDRVEFIKAMVKEVDDHCERDHWEVIDRTSIGGATTLKRCGLNDFRAYYDFANISFPERDVGCLAQAQQHSQDTC